MRFISLQFAFVSAFCLLLPEVTVGDPSDITSPLSAYTIEVSTNCGQSLIAHKPAATTVDAALQSTVHDLAAYFGANPTIGSAFQSAKDPNSGGATFGATLNGQSIRGLISCKIHDNAGATVAVIYGVTDAPKSEWDKLMKPSAQPDAAGPADANIPLKEYDYPDGTGKIGIPDGWNVVNAPSELHPCSITGPADQIILLHNGVSVVTPDSPQVQNRQQMDAQRARMGYPPLPPLIVAPFTDPADALQNLIPQFSANSQAKGGPAITLDKIISSQDRSSPLTSGKRAIITYAFTKTTNGQPAAFRAQVDLIVSPLSSGSAWMYFARYSISSPDATFDQDLPVMLAIVHSDIPNGQQAMKVAQAENSALWQAGQTYFSNQRKQELAQFQQFQQSQNQRFAIGQEQHDVAVDAQADNKTNFEANQLTRSRNSADFEQTVLGYETIEDTKYGNSGTADLSNVDAVVDGLNQQANDPTEWKKIPLRDEMFPLPQGQ